MVWDSLETIGCGRIIGLRWHALDCDGCLSHVAEFADAKLTGKTTCESMQAVQAHLENCPCCEHEFQMLVEALRALEGGSCGNPGR